MCLKEWILFFSYVSVIALGISFHEIWADEAHHWLLAKDSSSLSELISHMRYDGHPMLWNILLFYVAKTIPYPSGMQLLHVVISSIAGLLFIRNSPFSLLQKALFVFGYYMLFEYAIISRNYSIALIFFFLALALYPTRKRNAVLLGLALAGLANSHFLGLLLAGAFLFMLLIEFVLKKIKITRQHVISLLISVTGLGLSLIQIIPPPDSPVLRKASSEYAIDNIPGALTFLVKGMLPIPKPSLNFWNTNIFSSSPVFLAIFILLFLILFFVLFFKKQNVCTLFFSGLTAVLIFFFFSGFSGVRYFGMVYILFTGSCWLLISSSERSTENNSRVQIHGNTSAWLQSLLTALFLIHACIGIHSYTMDIIFPFSEAKNVAKYIQKNNMEGHTIVAEPFKATSVSAYLNRDIFVLGLNETASFNRWNLSFHMPSPQESLEKAQLLAATEKRPVLLVYTVKLPINGSKKITLLKNFNRAILPWENFYLYKVIP